MSVRQPAWLLWATVPAILLAAAFGMWLRMDVHGPTTLDQDWLNLVGLTPDSVPYWIAVVLAEVGGGAGAAICTGVLAAAFVLLRRFRAAGFLVTAMLVGICLSELLKALVIRARPSHQLFDSLGYSYPSGHSMGAAALAMGLAFIASRSHMMRLEQATMAGRMDPSSSASPAAPLAAAPPTISADGTHAEPLPAAITPPLEPPRLRFHWSMIVALVWILTMMWSRTALQVHWLSDTIAGALIGISAAVLADELWTAVTMKTRSPHLER